jgi:hypothetical protein
MSHTSYVVEMMKVVMQYITILLRKHTTPDLNEGVSTMVLTIRRFM